MRGSPLIRALIVFAALLALAPVLWRMTQAVPVVVPSAGVPQLGPKEIQIAIAFTALPKRIAIHHLDAELWAKDSPEKDEELSLQLPWPKEGVELLFKVAWPDEAQPAAVRVTLTDPAGSEIERILWGSGASQKVLRFP